MSSKRGLGIYHERRALADMPVILPTEALRERLEQEQHMESEQRTTFIEWGVRIPEPKTGTLDFRRWPFQKQMYEVGADAHEGVVKKATQVGVSSYLIRWAMYWPDMKGLTSMYVFPKKVQLHDFSQGRIRPLIRKDGGYLQSRVPRDNIDNALMKQVGLGLIYFRGSEVKDDLDSVDADCLAFDEYDRLDQNNIEDAEHRVDASPLGLIRRVGNPTFDEFGIAAAYDESDQRHWNVKCQHCGEWQELDFWRNVDQQRLAVVCRECDKPLDVRVGEWVAKHPARDIPGWHVSRLMVHGVNLSKIVRNSRKEDPYAKQTFYNKDLGLAYTPGEARLAHAVIKAAQTIMGQYNSPFTYESANPVTMGVDVASKRALTAEVAEWLEPGVKKRILWTGEVMRWYAHDDGDGPSLQELMQRYGVNMCGFDHEPEYLSVRGFANAFPGRVCIINYATQQQLVRVDMEMATASVRRTENIDRAFTRWRQQKVGLPMDIPADYIAQMRNAVRVVDEDEKGRNEKGRKVARYTKVNKSEKDDFVHADVYADVAADYFAILVKVIEAQEDQYSQLDDHMEFVRSNVNDQDDMEYRAGPEREWDPESDPLADF